MSHADHQAAARKLRKIKQRLLRHQDVVRQANAARAETIHGSAVMRDGQFEVIERERWQSMVAAWPDARAIRQSSCWQPHQGPRECARRLRQVERIGKGTGRRAQERKRASDMERAFASALIVFDQLAGQP